MECVWNTTSEFDGNDASADPDEAIIRGKIRINANPVKVCADATISFPLIVSHDFAKDVEGWKKDDKESVCWLWDDDDEWCELLLFVFVVKFN